MSRRIIRDISQTKSGFDFFLLPIMALLSKNKQEVISLKVAKDKKHEGKNPLPRSDNYIEQVLKYIPSEIVAAYLFVEGILKSVDNIPRSALWFVFTFLLIITPLYIWATTTDKKHKEDTSNKPAAWDQIIISSLSFAVWVFAIGGPFAFLSWYNPVYGSVLLVLFTFLPPIITKIICRIFTLASCHPDIKKVDSSRVNE